MKSFLQTIFFLIIFFIVPVGSVYADVGNVKNNYGYPQQKSSNQTEDIDTALQLALIKNNHQYVMIIAALFCFALIVIAFLMKITAHQARDLVTIIGLVSVIFGVILLVLVVDTTETLTAPMGIFGAIAGYLFGTAQKKNVSE